jgi:hypothetical protein
VGPLAIGRDPGMSAGSPQPRRPGRPGCAPTCRESAACRCGLTRQAVHGAGRCPAASRPSKEAASRTSAWSWPSSSDGAGWSAQNSTTPSTSAIQVAPVAGCRAPTAVGNGRSARSSTTRWPAASWYYGGGQRGWPLKRLTWPNVKIVSLHLIAPVIGVRHHREAAERAVAGAAPAQVTELLGGRRAGRAAPGPAASLVAGHGGGDRGWPGRCSRTASRPPARTAATTREVTATHRRGRHRGGRWGGRLDRGADPLAQVLGGEFAGPFGQGPAAAAGLDLTPAVLACQQVCFEPVTVAPWELAAEVGGGGPLRVMAHGGLPAVRGPLGPAPCGRGAPRPARSPGGSQGSRRLRRR